MSQVEQIYAQADISAAEITSTVEYREQRFLLRKKLFNAPLFNEIVAGVVDRFDSLGFVRPEAYCFRDHILVEFPSIADVETAACLYIRAGRIDILIDTVWGQTYTLEEISDSWHMAIVRKIMAVNTLLPQPLAEEVVRCIKSSIRQSY